MSVDYKMSCLEFQAPYPGKRGWCLSQWPHSRSASDTWETSQETQLAPFIFISLIWMERWWISWKIPALWCVLGSSGKQWVSVATRLTGRQQVPLDRVLECQNLHCTISMPASWGVSGVSLLMLHDTSCIQVCSYTHLGLYKTTSNNKQAKEVILA